jgi:hypothetical protein
MGISGGLQQKACLGEPEFDTEFLEAVEIPYSLLIGLRLLVHGMAKPPKAVPPGVISVSRFYRVGKKRVSSPCFWLIR